MDNILPQSPRRRLDKQVLGKLDGGLRRLLVLEDAEIIQAVEKDRIRAREQLKRLLSQELEPGRTGPVTIPRDRRLVDRGIARRPSAVLPHPTFGAVDIDPLQPKVAKIRAIVNFTGNRADLAGLGLQVRAQAQDVFTVVGTPNQIRSLASQAACQRLRLPRMFVPVVENGCAQAEITDVHTARPVNPNGYQGAGVLVGLIDTALDVSHHTFRDPAGTHGTRLLYYWVQTPYTRTAAGGYTLANLATLPGQDPDAWTLASPAIRPNFNGLNYGRIYTQGAIDTALGLANPFGTGNNQICCQPWYQVVGGNVDSEHGTHTAGIAAGNGHEANWGTAPTHIGAAPQATIIYVNTSLMSATMGFEGTWEDAILDGIDFCLRAAQFHNMPLVISISQGTSFGPHNGTTDLDQGIDNFLNSFFDRSVVLAAGNDNNDNGYRTGSLAANNTLNLSLTALRNSPVYLEAWTSGPELDYRITYGGANSGWRTAGQDYAGTLGGHDVEVDRDTEPGGMRNIRFYFPDAFNGCVYTIELRNPNAAQAADYHLWTGLQGWWASINGSSQNSRTLSDSACGKSTLTVGACQKLNPANPAGGELIANFSGAGTTLDGRIKPEITAVGNQVISAASNQASGWVSMNGTSMSAPLVAGGIAVLFDAYHQPPLNLPLNQDTIKALLTQNANRLNLHLDPSQAGYVETERNLYGYGRLRMIAPVDLVQPPLNVDVWVRTADDDYGQEPYPGGCFCGSPDIRVFQAGTTTPITQLNWGTTYDVRVTVRNLGDDNAVGTTVRLKYTLPWAAPNDWHAAEDASNHALVATVTIPALNQAEVPFSWRPEAAEIGAPATSTHFCLLAELDHPLDPLVYAAPSGGGGSAWTTNIKGTNNVALRNLHIQ